MPFKIVRNDITKMKTQAIVNTANPNPTVGTGCDTAIYEAAGYDKLLEARKKIGAVLPGEAFLTSGFKLHAKYIIHTVSPAFVDGNHGEEQILRSCYRNSLRIAKEKKVKSIAFPLISTGGLGYPKEEGMRIAVDEINAFLLANDMLIYLVVFGDAATKLGTKLYPDLESYIDRNYVEQKRVKEYGGLLASRPMPLKSAKRSLDEIDMMPMRAEVYEATAKLAPLPEACVEESVLCDDYEFTDKLENALNERMKHMSDTYSEYLMYLIETKGMENADVYKRAIVDKKVFSKIKNNPDYHPQKVTALRLCIGAKLNLDEAKDLLARAGYALSPCDKTDIIFSYFIENGIYDMIELDIQLEEHGLPCAIA